MTYALSTIWYERQRFLPAVLAVAFSAVLIAVQGGLVIGLLAMMSIPIDKAAADVWVGYPNVRSVDLGRPVPSRWVARVAADPGVERVEGAVVGFTLWSPISPRREPTTPEVVTVVGCRIAPDGLGVVEALRDRPEVLAKLRERGAVVVDEGELGRLGCSGVGDLAEVMGTRVRIVGLVRGYKSLGGPYCFCSLETSKQLMRTPPDRLTYFLARCKTPADAEAVARRVGRYATLSSHTAEQFSRRSRLHWLFTTKAGLAMGFTAFLGLLVGAVVTSQTLYAATAASHREFATMRAMGIPSWRLRLTVLEQSLWVGLMGIVVAAPCTVLLGKVAEQIGTEVRLHPYVLLAAAALTLLMALGSGLAALRSFQGVDPAVNIR